MLLRLEEGVDVYAYMCARLGMKRNGIQINVTTCMDDAWGHAWCDSIAWKASDSSCQPHSWHAT